MSLDREAITNGHGGHRNGKDEIRGEVNREAIERDLRELAGCVDRLTTTEAAAMLIELASLQAAVATRLRAMPLPAREAGAVVTEDRLLTAEDVAGRFGRSIAWVYRQAPHWSFTRRVTRRTIRFSEHGLQRFLAQRRTFTP